MQPPCAVALLAHELIAPLAAAPMTLAMDGDVEDWTAMSTISLATVDMKPVALVSVASAVSCALGVLGNITPGGVLGGGKGIP